MTAATPGATASAATTPTTNGRVISRWIFPPPLPDADARTVADLARSLRLPPAAIRILWGSGLTDGPRIHNFLNPRIEDLHDPFLLKDMDRAIARIRKAIAGCELIEIHGDYDVALGFVESRRKRGGLAEVAAQSNDFKPSISLHQVCQQLEAAVGRSIVHEKNFVGTPQLFEY